MLMLGPAAAPVVAKGVSTLLPKVIGGIAGILGANIDRQSNKQALTHGIRWRVADAKAAGLHPLAALGANVIPGAPSRVGEATGDAIAQTAAASTQDRITNMAEIESASRTNANNAAARASDAAAKRANEPEMVYKKVFNQLTGKFEWALTDPEQYSEAGPVIKRTEAAGIEQEKKRAADIRARREKRKRDKAYKRKHGKHSMPDAGWDSPRGHD
ncbi:DNA pilot protein [Microviridae sp.]|nr:DNA pilot protein [Microviridae sp.]